MRAATRRRCLGGAARTRHTAGHYIRMGGGPRAATCQRPAVRFTDSDNCIALPLQVGAWGFDGNDQLDFFVFMLFFRAEAGAPRAVPDWGLVRL